MNLITTQNKIKGTRKLIRYLKKNNNVEIKTFIERRNRLTNHHHIELISEIRCIDFKNKIIFAEDRAFNIICNKIWISRYK